MNKKIKNFRDLDIWEKGIEIVKDIYKTVREFPKLELYSLTNQIQRASLSIPTNIAEGFKCILFFWRDTRYEIRDTYLIYEIRKKG